MPFESRRTASLPTAGLAQRRQFLWVDAVDVGSDVEGSFPNDSLEARALPLPKLSFEQTTAKRDVAVVGQDERRLLRVEPGEASN